MNRNALITLSRHARREAVSATSKGMDELKEGEPTSTIDLEPEPDFL